MLGKSAENIIIRLVRVGSLGFCRVRNKKDGKSKATVVEFYPPVPGIEPGPLPTDAGMVTIIPATLRGVLIKDNRQYFRV